MRAFMDRADGPSARGRMEAAGRAFAAKQRTAQVARVEEKQKARRKEALAARRAFIKTREAAMEKAAYIAEKVYRTIEARGTMRDVLAAVVARTGISKEDILSTRRSAIVVRARHECFWLCKRITTHSLPQIGRFFGRDHTTILSGIRKHAARMVAA